ncbi:hypothetical protein P3S68_019082 [Capsicum galapagoense]
MQASTKPDSTPIGSSSGFKVEYIAPDVDSKLVEIELEDISSERLWTKYDINKISMLRNEIVLVRFDHEDGKNAAIEEGIYHFDNKPFIVKAWSPGMEFTREELQTVPIWIKFPGLDFKYWSPKGLSKLGNLVGKPLMVDQSTEKKLGLNFARLLVEVSMDVTLLDSVVFKNEKSQLIRQKVQYDCKPILCKHYGKYGHSEENCRKKQTSKVVPIISDNADQGQGDTKVQVDVAKMKQQDDTYKTGNGKIPPVPTPNDGIVWITPQHRGRQRQEINNQIESEKKFEVLQRMSPGKKDVIKSASMENDSPHSQLGNG